MPWRGPANAQSLHRMRRRERGRLGQHQEGTGLDFQMNGDLDRTYERANQRGRSEQRVFPSKNTQYFLIFGVSVSPFGSPPEVGLEIVTQSFGMREVFPTSPEWIVEITSLLPVCGKQMWEKESRVTGPSESWKDVRSAKPVGPLKIVTCVRLWFKNYINDYDTSKTLLGDKRFNEETVT
eukprot:1637179-Amphidinium_carterae.1